MTRQHVPFGQCEPQYSSLSSVQQHFMLCIGEARPNVGLLQLFLLVLCWTPWFIFLRHWNIRKWTQDISLSICLFGSQFLRWRYEQTGFGRYG